MSSVGGPVFVPSPGIAAKARRILTVAHSETRHLLPLRLGLVRILCAPLPNYVGSRLRVALLRRAGFSIGRGTVMWGFPGIYGEGEPSELLRIGSLCRFNIGCIFDVNAPITIGDEVGCGQQVMFLTATHEIGGPLRRSGRMIPAGITVGRGCWLGARATILPGVTIGDGVVVAAGAVVTKDVAPNTLVAGVPARPIRCLPDPAAVSAMTPEEIEAANAALGYKTAGD